MDKTKKYKRNKNFFHTNVAEFNMTANGIQYSGILGVGTYYNWIAFPSIGYACELADFFDDFWNMESLSAHFNEYDGKAILTIIHEVSELLQFGITHNYTDGKRFMSQREYIFWLENECESLSYQITKLEMIMDDE